MEHTIEVRNIGKISKIALYGVGYFQELGARIVWYYHTHGLRQGTVGSDEIRSLREGVINPQTQIKKDGWKEPPERDYQDLFPVTYVPQSLPSEEYLVAARPINNGGLANTTQGTGVRYHKLRIIPNGTY